MATAAAGGAKPGFESLDAAAMPFITVDDHDRFEVNPEAVRYLKTLTGRVAVVSIAGAPRAPRVAAVASPHTPSPQPPPRPPPPHPRLVQASTARGSRTC